MGLMRGERCTHSTAFHKIKLSWVVDGGDPMTAPMTLQAWRIDLGDWRLAP